MATPIRLVLVAACLSCGGGLEGVSAGTLILQSAGAPVFVRIEPADGCPAVNGLEGQLNGSALHVDSRGGPTGTILGGCKAIQLSGASAGGSDAQLTVGDGHATWHMDVPGFFEARALEVGAPLRVGQSAQVSVTPATDSFDTAPGSSVSFLAVDAGIEFTVKEGVTVSGATVTFPVPSSVHGLGDAGVSGTLFVSPGIPLAKVERCDGPARCRATLVANYRAPAVLFP